MRTALALSIPGMVVLLVVVWAYEATQQKRGRRRGTPLSTTYVNELTAIFHGTKRAELDHRESTSLLRDDDTKSTAPGLTVDLDRGIAVVPNDDPRGPINDRTDP